MHPAAPAALIGASLEEFLRNLVDAHGFLEKISKPGIDAYAKTLKTNDLINAQDMKDITSWAGIRNSAAHGKFEDLSKDQINLMLQGINLFMRKYSK